MTTDNHNIVLGVEHAYGGARRPLEIEPAALLQHAFVIGQTGVGKTTLLLNLTAQLIEQGAGVGFIDPHGSAADELLQLIPRRRTREVVHLRAHDTDRPITFNPLKPASVEDHHRVASAVGEAVRAVHADSWGDRLDWILYNSLRALLYTPGATVLDVPRLLVDELFRVRVVERVEDGAVVSFWLDEFAGYDRSFRSVAVAPVQNKVGKLRAHPPLRAILGDPNPRVDFGELLTRSQLLVADLSGIGESSTDFLGSLLVSALYGAALSRGPESASKAFYLVIDESHRFTTETLSSVLSEARKYGLGMILADQFLDQAEITTQRAVLGNAGSFVSFRISGTDAKRLAEHYGGRMTPDRFTDLEPHEAIIKSLDGGEVVGPAKMTTLRLWPHRYGRGEHIRKSSRERYGRKAKRPA